MAHGCHLYRQYIKFKLDIIVNISYKLKGVVGTLLITYSLICGRIILESWVRVGDRRRRFVCMISGCNLWPQGLLLHCRTAGDSLVVGDLGIRNGRIIFFWKKINGWSLEGEEEEEDDKML